jgi:6-phosphogluconate dehydrogenase (decarboxylating)
VQDGGVDDAEALASPGGSLAERLVELIEHLDEPRLFVLDLPVGPTIDRLIDAAYVIMGPGDVVIDTSASYWCDTLRRYARMRHRSLFYIDVGLLPGGILVSGTRKALRWPCRCSSDCRRTAVWYGPVPRGRPTLPSPSGPGLPRQWRRP